MQSVVAVAIDRSHSRGSSSTGCGLQILSARRRRIGWSTYGVLRLLGVNSPDPTSEGPESHPLLLYSTEFRISQASGLGFRAQGSVYAVPWCWDSGSMALGVELGLWDCGAAILQTRPCEMNMLIHAMRRHHRSQT